MGQGYSHGEDQGGVRDRLGSCLRYACDRLSELLDSRLTCTVVIPAERAGLFARRAKSRNPVPRSSSISHRSLEYWVPALRSPGVAGLAWPGRQPRLNQSKSLCSVTKRRVRSPLFRRGRRSVGAPLQRGWRRASPRTAPASSPCSSNWSRAMRLERADPAFPARALFVLARRQILKARNNVGECADTGKSAHYPSSGHRVSPVFDWANALHSV
jgi:hypothetical protein